MPHAIRLLGPWRLAPLTQTAGTDVPTATPSSTRKGVTVRVPADWSEALPGFRGAVRWTRHFGCPRHLDPDERVFLVFEAIRGRSQLRLNQQDLGDPAPSGPRRVEITGRLVARNELTADIEWPSPLDPDAGNGQAGGIVGEVRLEIVSGG